MLRVLAIALALAMLGLVAWGLFVEAGALHIVVNGQEITGPMKGAVGAAGFLVALIAFFCAAIFLAFVVAGIGLVIVGGMLVGLLFLAGFTFPLALVILVPLALVWLVAALARGAGPRRGRDAG